MVTLTAKKCVPCEGGAEPLTAAQAAKLLAELAEGWESSADGKEISRTFKFEDFYQTMSFVNAVAWIASTENHHPDLDIGYGHCRVRLSTHAIDGLSENDFICGAKIDALLA